MMTDASVAPSRARPAVSVVVPFFGTAEDADRLGAGLEALRLRDADELVVADNTSDGVAEKLSSGGTGIRVVPAGSELSSYHARNVGADRAANAWLLFMDADCVPEVGLLDSYFSRPVSERTGALAGSITGDSTQRGLMVEWAETRGILSQERILALGAGAVTANLLVRRAAWADVGGFQEGIRSGGDLEFCWRLADAGWGIDPRPEARVAHRHRERLLSALRVMARYSAGNAWQERRRPGSALPLGLAGKLARSLGGLVWFGLTLRFRRSALKGIDGLAVLAQALGRRLDNRARAYPGSATGGASAALVIATDRFPVPSETFVTNEIAALDARGNTVAVEVVQRPSRPALGGARAARPRYLEDEGSLERLRALVALMALHPLRCFADLASRRRFSADEVMPLAAIAPFARRLERQGTRHVHVHFGALACVNALRAGRIAGVPVSFAGHGHELFVTPRALPEKIARAAFVIAPCEYTAAHLRSLAPHGAEDRVHVVVMGIDGARFRRRAPYPGGRTVAAVGRLVEKKGFGDLLAAAALLDASEPLDALLLAGDGPLRESLAAAIERRGLADRVEMLGLVTPAEVSELLERSDLLVVPCVIAADGDRDAMPVVAKEALAMAVPVVASDEVGLPELVRPEWGRLVAPGNPKALANAMAELLALPAGERGAMGAAGREFVLANFSLDAQVEGLLRLIADAGGGSAGGEAL